MNEEQQEYAIRPNKEDLKREYKALHALGRELVELPKALFITIPLSERAKDQIFAAKNFKKSALQRQLRFISALMKEEKVDAIYEALRLIKLPHKKEVEQFHQLEIWRDQLIAGDYAVFTELLDTHPVADRQYINQLTRNAKKEAKQNKPPKSSRMLFKYLQELQKNQGEK
jgi:ribosome-associated protein